MPLCLCSLLAVISQFRVISAISETGKQDIALFAINKESGQQEFHTDNEEDNQDFSVQNGDIAGSEGNAQIFYAQNTRITTWAGQCC